MATYSNQIGDATLVSNSMSTSTAPENYLFLGNPGTGKSTLINCLAGSAIFNSGLSYGTGMTTNFQKRIHDNVHYMDTPGLADRKIQKSAAAAITEALQQSGTYKLFFMVRLENGRVVSDDLATIEIVLSSIDLDEILFTVIVNNVKKRQYMKMAEKGADYLKVVTLINSIKHTTHHITFIPVIEELDEEDNVVTKLPSDVESFIRVDAPTVQIPPHVVNSIKIEDFKKVSESLRQAQEELLRDNALMEHHLAELMGKSNSFGGTFNTMGDFLSSMADRVMHSGKPPTGQHRDFIYDSGGNSNTGTTNHVQQMEYAAFDHYQYNARPDLVNVQKQYPNMNATTTSTSMIYSNHVAAPATGTGVAHVAASTLDKGAQPQNEHRTDPLTMTNHAPLLQEDAVSVATRIQNYSQHTEELKQSSDNLMRSSGLTSSIAKTPVHEEMPQVDPIRHSIPVPMKETAQKSAEGQLDEEDVK